MKVCYKVVIASVREGVYNWDLMGVHYYMRILTFKLVEIQANTNLL